MGCDKNMIISHKYRFIYIKTLKTAGTSLEIALSKFCGPADIITHIDAADEATRHALGYRGAQNFRPCLSRMPSDLKFTIRSDKGIVKYFNHMPATMARDRLPPEIWNSYYKFTSARHPLDLAGSLYAWRKRSEPGLRDMAHFLRVHGSQLYRNTLIVSEEDRFLLNGFARYEHFEEDLDRIGERIGLPESLWGVFRGIRAKGSVRAPWAGTDDLLGPAERDVVRFLCAREFEFYGYE
jgi:hypothetical protein